MAAPARPAFKTEPAFHYTQAPNTEWKLGEGLSRETKIGKEWVEGEKQGFTTIDPAVVSPGYVLASHFLQDFLR